MPKISVSVILISIFSLTVGTGIYFLVLPQIKELSDLHTQTVSLNQQSNANNISSISPALQAQENNLLQLLPTDSNQYDLTIQIEALSAQQNIQLTALSVGTTAGTVPASSGAASTGSGGAGTALAVSNIPFSMNFTTNYQNVQQYIQGLLSLGRFLHVQQVLLTKASANPNNGASNNTSVVTPTATPTPVTSDNATLNVQIVGVAYYMSSNTTNK
jgi:Tfp pilus assembly protein PilO